MTVGGADINKTCIFPFKVGNDQFTTCYEDSDGFWCSTLVDELGEHVADQDNWGFCGPNCPMPRTKC